MIIRILCVDDNPTIIELIKYSIYDRLEEELHEKAEILPSPPIEKARNGISPASIHHERRRLQNTRINDDRHPHSHPQRT